MEEKKNNKELLVYLFEVTQDALNPETEEPTGERETSFAEYAFRGDPSPVVDYGDYWTFGDGCISLVAMDGRCIESDLESVVEALSDSHYGFKGSLIRELAGMLDSAGKWVETSAANRNGKLRITRLSCLPEIDPEATIDHSDLNEMQMWRIRINGKPLFDEGGTVGGDKPSRTTVLFRPNLEKELGEVWKTFIAAKCGATVDVSVDNSDISADCVTRSLEISAPTMDDLSLALGAIGVKDPAKVKPNVVFGEGDEAKSFVARVRIVEKVLD